MEQAAAFVQRIIDAGKKEWRDLLVICPSAPDPPSRRTWHGSVAARAELDGFFWGFVDSSGLPPRSRSRSRLAASKGSVTLGGTVTLGSADGTGGNAARQR